MGRLPRKVLSDGLYHAYARGTGPIVIFQDRVDYDGFVVLLRRVAARFEWELSAYCLMPTHYHLVLQARLEHLSQGMHRLNGSYAQQFNRRHKRVGHLFQERFAARLIENEHYRERVSAYVVGNAARAGHCDTPTDWPWCWSAYEP